MLLNVTNAWNMTLMAEMLIQDITNTRFDYHISVPTTKPWLTSTGKGKLPQTNNQFKPATADSGYDKNRLKTIPNKDNQKRDNPHAKPPRIKCYKCNQEGHRSNACP
jgi:hypothetical protein